MNGMCVCFVEVKKQIMKKSLLLEVLPMDAKFISL
jgi:hypothetical protein